MIDRSKGKKVNPKTKKYVFLTNSVGLTEKGSLNVFKGKFEMFCGVNPGKPLIFYREMADP